MARARKRKLHGSSGNTASCRKLNRRRKYQEPIKKVEVWAKALTTVLKDRRTGLVQGQLSDVCFQNSIDVSLADEGMVTLSAPRVRMQKVLEKIHFAGIPYQIGS